MVFRNFGTKYLMSGIFIESSNSKNLKLLAELAERLGEKVSKLTTSETEDLQLAILMKNEKTGEAVSRENVFKHLDGK